MVRASTIALALGLAVVALPAAVQAQVRVEKDIKYETDSTYDNNKDRLDVYIPAHARAAPVIISVHGGALTEGDKSEQTFVGQRFASAGVVTVVVNYRLSPGVTHPAHVTDLARAAAWVKRNIGNYGGDPKKMFLVGHSAGGYLISLLLLDVRYLAYERLQPDDFRGAVPVSGFFYVDSPGVGPDRPKFIWGDDPKAWKAASPAKYVRAHLPPFLLLYADGDADWRRQQQDDFAADLRATGDTDVAVHMIAGRDHYTVWNAMASGDEETSRSVLQFIDKVLKRKPDIVTKKSAPRKAAPRNPASKKP
jgi:acetyl esterase/lipase